MNCTIFGPNLCQADDGASGINIAYGYVPHWLDIRRYTLWYCSCAWSSVVVVGGVLSVSSVSSVSSVDVVADGTAAVSRGW